MREGARGINELRKNGVYSKPINGKAQYNNPRKLLVLNIRK